MSIITGTNRGNGFAISSLTAIFASSASSAMRAVERAATEVAPTELPIFIVGESGTGKGTLATMIHRLSKRCEYDLVKVNCQSLQSQPGTTGAPPPLGLNERQVKGTVLLDEVLALEPGLQPHVMTMLPEGDPEFDGAVSAPRILAATRSEETELPGNSLFSRELYYRLRGVVLRIPPLRERREDIPLLAHFLINKHAATFGRTIRLSWRAERRFQSHSWPGNVRELENAVKTLLAVDDEDLVLDAIGLSGAPSAEVNANQKPESTVSLKEASRTASRSAEKQLIREVLERTRWNRKRAAKELNISYKALLYKLKQNGLHDPSAEESLGRGTTK
jgi:DNA-binding NtrC family response regulator